MRKQIKMKLGCLVAAMMLAMTAVTAQGMGIYAGVNLGYGQFGFADQDDWDEVITPRFRAFALTPVVGITPFQGNGNFVLERLAFEFQLAMKFGKWSYYWANLRGNEIRPGLLAKFNFSIADWAALFGGSGPAWGDRLVTFGGLGFGIPIRTVKLSYDGIYDGVESKASDVGFQLLMEYGLAFKINDKFSVNAAAGFGFIGPFTYDLTLGAAYHFR